MLRRDRHLHLDLSFNGKPSNHTDLLCVLQIVYAGSKRRPSVFNSVENFLNALNIHNLSNLFSLSSAEMVI